MALLYAKYNSYYRFFALALLALAVALAVLMLYAESDYFIALFSDKDALTGRVQIWPPLVQYARDHWLAGSGFGSFWDVGDSKPIARYVDSASSWVVDLATGHNGYLDMLVQTGLPGLLFAVLATIVAPLIKLLSSTKITPSQGSLILACVLFAAGHNFTESDLFQRDAVSHVYLMFALALLYALIKEARPPSAPN